MPECPRACGVTRRGYPTGSIALSRGDLGFRELGEPVDHLLGNLGWVR